MILDKISKTGIIPVIKLNQVEKSKKLAHALMSGGVNIAEVTFRAEGAETVIERMIEEEPQMIVGAGTVVSLSQAKRAASAGASFIVSPGLNEEIIRWTMDNGLLVFPGCVTPTEIIKAINLGIDVVKFFPAEQFGGLKTIKALSEPFSNIKFIPTGGISFNNLAEYIGNPKIVACGGSFIVSEKLLNESQFEEITTLCNKAKKVIDESRKE